MRYAKGALLVGFVAAALLGAMVLDASAAAPPVPCAPPHNMGLHGLEMVPATVHEGQQIRWWNVKIYTSNLPCTTTIYIKDDQGAAVGQTSRPVEISRTVHTYQIPVHPAYKLHAKEHCFHVEVDLLGTLAKVTEYRVCARQVIYWTTTR